MAKLSEYNSSLETAREWISELMETLQTDEAKACRAFRVVTHALRDQLTLAEAADLAAQMPLLLRGVFFEGWRPAARTPERKTKQELVEEVALSFQEIPDLYQVETMVARVFMFLDRRISAGEIGDVVRSLPKDLRSLWPSYTTGLPA